MFGVFTRNPDKQENGHPEQIQMTIVLCIKYLPEYL
jgi:hypothetical protein